MVNDIKKIINALKNTEVDRFSMKTSLGDVPVEISFSYEKIPSFPVAVEERTESENSTEYQDNKIHIRSKWVGKVILNDSKSGKPFVSKGSKVKKGQVVAVIEVLNVKQEVVADEDGIVEEILVSDGQPVGYNQELMLIAK